MLHIGLHFGVGELATNQSLSIEDTIEEIVSDCERQVHLVEYSRVDWVHGDLVLRSVTDETLIVGEGDIGGCCSVTLVVGDDFNSVILPYTDTAVTMKVSDHCKEQTTQTLTSMWYRDQYQWLLMKTL